MEARHGPADPAGAWLADFDAAPGDLYWWTVDDGPPLVDPACLDLAMTSEGPRCVVRDPWPVRPQAAQRTDAPIVYELHVKGFGGSYLGCIEHLDHVVSTGANVIELLPVHPFDDGDNYWGYMPIVWGALHRPYALDAARAAEELGDLIAAAHDRGLCVWLDVVFNHAGEADEVHTTWGFRGLDPQLYRHGADGRPTNDSGCGNDVEPAHPHVRFLVLQALDRLADLGVDGFRFDLASLLTRDGGGLVDLVTEWGTRRGVELIAEAWDLGAYQVGHGWPWSTWWQWNDRFRDDVRGFLRGEPGLVHAVRQRVAGSPDLFGPGGATRSLNFITAHDGLTMYDLTTVTTDRHHSWDTGDALRAQQLKNYFSVLLLSSGGAMWVQGDEFGRTQHQHDNPFDIDGPLSWVDWSTAGEWTELTSYVQRLCELRRRHPVTDVRFYGVGPDIDEHYHSHSLAWCTGSLYVMANAWWDPLEFELQEPGEWRVVLASATPAAPSAGRRFTLAGRSTLVLQRL